MENNEQKPTRCGFVSLIGAPNAGKSTITNDFVGSKVSIVSPKAQTTRTLVKGIGIFDNTQIIFLDTPGIFKPKRRFDRSMVASAWSGASDGDILVLVVDARRGFDAETRAIVDELNKQGREAVLVLNKTDLVTGEKLLPLAAELNAAGKFAETFMVSAATGEGLRDFYQYLADHLPESPWYYPEDHMSDLPLRLLAAEGGAGKAVFVSAGRTAVFADGGTRIVGTPVRQFREGGNDDLCRARRAEENHCRQGRRDD